jgi:hypothetical protein
MRDVRIDEAGNPLGADGGQMVGEVGDNLQGWDYGT